MLFGRKNWVREPAPSLSARFFLGPIMPVISRRPHCRTNGPHKSERVRFMPPEKTRDEQELIDKRRKDIPVLGRRSLPVFNTFFQRRQKRNKIFFSRSNVFALKSKRPKSSTVFLQSTVVDVKWMKFEKKNSF